jgi:nitrite reductase (NADH) large subunit
MPDPNTARRCSVCGYVHRGSESPQRCPICGASQEDFELVQQPNEASPKSAKTARVIVIGGGIAGVSAVESVRTAAPETEVILISQEKEHPYYRLNLTRYLAGEIQREDLFIHPATWYQQHGIQLLLGSEVVALDPENHAVELRDGKRLPFDKLLLAAGAYPFVPPIPGSDRDGAACLRTIDDADCLLEACRAGARCVCIGGGLLGLETAGAMARRGAEVTLLENQGWLLRRQLSERAGEILGDYVGQLGIKLLKNAVTGEIFGKERVQGVLLEDGSRIPADLVLIATGIRANSSLASRAGLNVDRAVVVDNRLRSSHPDILAAGDVAEHGGVVYGLWTVSQTQGTVAGMNLAGASAEFGGLPRSTTLKVLGFDVFSVGQIAPEDARCQVIEEEADDRYVRFVFREGRLVGTILLGDTKLMAPAKRAVEDKQDFSSLMRGRPTVQAVVDLLRQKRPTSPQTQPAPPPAVLDDIPSFAKPMEDDVMGRFRCPVCGFVYDEEEEDRKWDQLPDDWVCPVCGEPKSSFEALGGDTKESVPPTLGRAVTIHRVFGYVFLALYVVLMVQMVPRLWTYQIEFPARTVVHMSLGMAIGAVLILKIAVVRYFRRLEQALVPLLGTSLVVASVVLIGISVPAAFREALSTGRLFTEENRQRVRALLAQTGLNEVECTRLASTNSLRAGQRVLRQQCIECHDLRTVLAKPRTPDNWRQTVRRMADRTTMLNPLEEEEQWQVTAYLIALSPQLQRSTRQLRVEEDRRDESRQAAELVATEQMEPVAYDAAAAKRLFENKCSQCHEINLVAESPPGSEGEARELVTWMVEEGLEATEEELTQIVRYLTESYAKAPE